MRKRFVIPMFLAALSATLLWAQGLVICRSCGRESKDPEATVCAHCKAELPRPKAPAPEAKPEPAPDKDAEVAKGAAAVVDASVRQARELEAKQPEVALSYYQNALALMRLVPPGTYPASVGESILAGTTRTMQLLVRGQVTCKKCSGTGKFQLDLGKVDGTSGVRAVSGVACPACKGAGSFAGFRDIAKVKMAILQGRQEFERRQMVAGDVKVGKALVPAALETLLTNRQRALVMTGMPTPCAECQLAGRQTCTACRGSGWIKCDYVGCSKGSVKAEQPGGLRQSKRLNDDLIRKCPRCDGLAEIPCQVCKGHTSVACKKCDGSGLAPRCARCTGTGLMTCPRCKGTGDLKGAVCPECKGETMILCTTCRGEGAVAR